MRAQYCAILSCLVLILSGCASPMTGGPPDAAQSLPPRPARINHFVAFKLIDPADAAELIADCDMHLGTIPGVVSYFAGQHHDTGRPTVYRDYDVGFFVGFDTDQDYALYVDHPSHVMVVQKWRPRLEWLRVYDVWDDGSR